MPGSRSAVAELRHGIVYKVSTTINIQIKEKLKLKEKLKKFSSKKLTLKFINFAALLSNIIKTKMQIYFQVELLTLNKNSLSFKCIGKFFI